MSVKHWIPILLILLAVWIPFGGSLRNERIGDDRVLIDSRLDPARVPGAAQLWEENYWGWYDDCGLYRPIALTALYAQRTNFGLATVPYRIVNLILYAFCGILCYVFLTQLMSPLAAAAAALLFVLHPAHVEVVITAYGQAEMLAGSMLFLALIGYVQAVRTNAIPWTMLTAITFLGAMLSKEIAICFPVLAALTRGCWLLPEEKSWRRWVAPRDAVYLAVVGVYAALKLAAIGTIAVPAKASTMAGFSLLSRLYTVLTHGLGNYLRLTLYPQSQSMVYDMFPDAVGDALWVVGTVLGLALVSRVVGLRPVVYATLWFAATWFIFSNLLVPTGVFVAERCLFLPVLAICVLAGLVAEHAWSIGAPIPRISAGLALAAMAIFAGVQATNTAYAWRTQESSLRAAVAEHPASPTARATLALTLLLDAQVTAPEVAEAESLLHDVVMDFPSLPEAHRGLGLAAKARGDYRRAVTHLRQGLELRPRDIMIQEDLAHCERLARGGD